MDISDDSGANASENKFIFRSEPCFWYLLSEENKQDYLKLRELFASPKCKNQRNKSNQAFLSIIDSIKSFVVRFDKDDWKRSIVCGIMWMNNSLAVNTHQLVMLTSKCKSSVNGSFQKIGYLSIQAGKDSAGEFYSKIPLEMQSKVAEMRQWTIRQKPQEESILNLVKEILKKKKTNFLDSFDTISGNHSIEADETPNAEKSKNEETPPPDISDLNKCEDFYCEMDVSLSDMYDNNNMTDSDNDAENDPYVFFPDCDQ